MLSVITKPIRYFKITQMDQGNILAPPQDRNQNVDPSPKTFLVLVPIPVSARESLHQTFFRSSHQLRAQPVASPPTTLLPSNPTRFPAKGTMNVWMPLCPESPSSFLDKNEEMRGGGGATILSCLCRLATKTHHLVNL